ncbi:MAG: hypothetical protein JWM56_699 [Candidatus Peribacteria bacterium]|nr:hypothetical protein [Candidatus Peribacteria bacterium]
MREHRLIYGKPAKSPEVVPEVSKSIAEQLKEHAADNTPVFLENLVLEIEESKRSEEVKSLRSSVDLDKISAAERVAIQKNLQHLEERFVTKQTADNLRKAHEDREKLIKTSGIPNAPVALKPEPTLWEKTKTKGSEIVEDINSWSWQKKAVVATATVGGLYLGYKALKWMFGGKEEGVKDQPKETGWKKWLPWIPGVGLLAAGSYGLYYVYNKYVKGSIKSLDDLKQQVADAASAAGTGIAAVKPLASGAAEAGTEAIKTSADIAKPAVNTVSEAVKAGWNFGERIADGDVGGAFEQLLQHGGGVITEGGKTFMVYGGKHLEIAGDLLNYAKANILGEEYKGRSLLKVYGAAGVLYVLDSAALSILLRGSPGLLSHGMKGSVLRIVGKTAGWPIMLLIDGVKTLGILSGDGKSVFINKLGGWPIIGSRARQMRQAMTLVKIGNADELVEATEKLIVLRNTLEQMKMRPDELIRQMGFSKSELLTLENQITKLSDKLHDAFAAVKDIPDNAPDYVKKIINTAKGMRDKKSFAEEFVKLIPNTTETASESASAAGNAGNAAGAADDAAKAASSADDAAKAAGVADDAADAAKTGAKAADAADTAGNAAKTGTTAADMATEAAKLKPSGEASEKFLEAAARLGKNADEVADMLKGTDPALVEKIMKSTIARASLLRAMAKGADAEKAILRAAKIASGLRVAGTTLSAGADAFGIAMAIVEWKANTQRIQDTNNPELKELYAEMNKMHAAEAASGAVGLGATGYAIFTGGGGGGSVMVAMLPVGLVIGGTAWAMKEMEYSREKWSMNANDWAKMPESQLFAKLEEFKPGSHNHGDEIIAARVIDDSQKAYDTVADGNTHTRNEICRALIQKHFEKLDQGRPGELQPAYDARKSTFVQTALAYIGNITFSRYDTFQPDIFREAEATARLAERAKGNEKETVEFQLNGVKKTLTYAEYAKLPVHAPERRKAVQSFMKQETEEKVVQMNVLIALNDTDAKKIAKATLITELSHDLNRLNGQIEKYNQGNWFADGADMARYTASLAFRNAVEREATALVAKKGEAEAADLQASLDRIKVETTTSPQEYYDRGTQLKFDITSFKDKQELLSVEYLIQTLDTPVTASKKV